MLACIFRGFDIPATPNLVSGSKLGVVALACSPLVEAPRPDPKFASASHQAQVPSRLAWPVLQGSPASDKPADNHVAHPFPTSNIRLHDFLSVKRLTGITMCCQWLQAEREGYIRAANPLPPLPRHHHLELSDVSFLLGHFFSSDDTLGQLPERDAP